MGLLDGKVAFITGGARGQGRAHAVVCASEGADVVIIDVAKQLDTVKYAMPGLDDLEETVDQVKALGRRVVAIQADVRSQDELDAAVNQGVSELGQIDILIANAGIWQLAPFWEMTEAEWDETIAVNLTGVWKSAKAVAPHMIERQSGSIVLISSVNGMIPAPNYAHYISAKFGVVGLMKAIALELAPYGIRCNSVHPGTTNTPMVNQQDTWDNMVGRPGSGAGTEADFFEGGRHANALKGRTFQDPKEIAKTALYLNSDLAANVTGVSIPVDGGMLLLQPHNFRPVKD